jgi:sugar lactone lactonase YvrE
MFDSRGAFLAQWTPVAACATHYGPGPIGIAVSNTDQIYVLDASNARVLVFAAPSRPAVHAWQTWGTYGTSEGTFYEPNGIAVDDHGLVYVSDGQGRVQVFTRDGAFIEKLGSYGEGPGQFRYPRGIVTFGERIYVVDPLNRRVIAFGSSGNYLHSWQVGDEPTGGPMAIPSGLATDEHGNVYVCATRDRIDIFDPDGGLLRSWHVPGPNEFVSVSDVAVGGEGRVYVADNFNRRVMRFDTNGTLLGELAIPADIRGGPVGLDVGPDGHLFVSTPAGILRYDPQDTFLDAWGQDGACEQEFSGTGDVAVDAQGNVFVTDVGNNRVQVFLEAHDIPGSGARGGGPP